jgi:hypothetical protein
LSGATTWRPDPRFPEPIALSCARNRGEAGRERGGAAPGHRRQAQRARRDDGVCFERGAGVPAEEAAIGQDTQQTVSEIEQTRDELARKVDELVDQAKVEASEVGKKLAVGGAALAALLVLGFIAKQRVRN